MYSIALLRDGHQPGASASPTHAHMRVSSTVRSTRAYPAAVAARSTCSSVIEGLHRVLGPVLVLE
jgi:hypothetical protein